MNIWQHILQIPQEINKVRMSENLLYALVWSAIYAVPMLNAEMTARQSLYFDEILLAWIKIMPFFFIFLIHNNIIAPNNLIRTKRYGRYIVGLLILFLATFGLVSFAQTLLMPYARIVLHEYEMLMTHNYVGSDGAIHNPMAITDFSLVWNIVFALFMTTANCGIKFIFKSMRDEQAMEQLRHQSLKVEMEYLKYQINPHFFMNTLNNIHALIDIDSATAKSAVIELSKMMRYVLYESGHESISLKQELHFVENYIELMRIRYDEQVRVSLRRPERLPAESSMPPLLLIVFIENAFKHGVRAVGESYVEIDIKCEDRSIEMTMRNSLSSVERKRDEMGGIGLINVRKRLELLYEDRFELRCERRESEYFVYLKIPNRDA